VIAHQHDAQLAMIGHAIPLDHQITSGEVVMATTLLETQNAIF
jgi:hypothetical protein